MRMSLGPASNIPHSPARSRFKGVALSLAGVLVAAATAVVAYSLHFNLSATVSIELLLVVLISLRWGFVSGSLASLTAAAFLNFFFIPPLFKFAVEDPENWVSLITFETAAIIVSRLSSQVRRNTEEVERQRARSMTLYELSRAILLIDNRTSLRQQLSQLIAELVHVQSVDVWTLYDHQSVQQTSTPLLAHPAQQAFLDNLDLDNASVTTRILRSGTTPVGAMILSHWQQDPLLADAVASLAAIAVERARAVQRENRAEAERNTEQLRSAVLDGLAHGFKTPLTAIRTASSGLLAIEQLTPTQTELVTIIDDRATMLTHLTTRLLQTAALERGELRIHRTQASLPQLVETILRQQDSETRQRIQLHTSANLAPVDIDIPMMELALLQLIDNAEKYSDVASTIDISITQSPSETTVLVKSRGCAVSKEERSLIFERFYRGTSAIAGPTGTGLGLSIVKKTAEAHGGRAWVEPDGVVSSFFLTVQHVRKARHNG